MDDLSKPERAKIAVRYLSRKLKKTQQDIGVMLGYKNKASFSAVRNGKSAYFSDSIPRRIAALAPEINIEFLEGTSDKLLLTEDNQPGWTDMNEALAAGVRTREQSIPPGSIIVPPELAKMLTSLSETVKSQQETIRQLVSERGNAVSAG